MSPGMTKSTSSQESADGVSHCASPESLTTSPSGQEAARVSRSPQQANTSAQPTSDTSGPRCDASSRSADQGLSSESKSPARQDADGSEGMRTCIKCETRKASSEFYRNSKGGYRKKCVTCICLEEQSRKDRIPSSKKSADFLAYRKRRRAKLLVGVAKNRAKMKGMDFDLDESDVRTLQAAIDRGICQATGIAFNLDGGKTWDSPSIDRIDNSKGYVKGNVRIVLYCLNVMANVWGENKILEISKAIATRRRSRSADLQSRLEESLKRRLDTSSSPEYALTWKEWAMESGPPICALRASARRTSGKGCTGWPTPIVNDATGSTHCYGKKNADDTRQIFLKLPGAAKMTGWPTPMAGSPATENYNEAGNTDYSRKCKDLLAGWLTPKLPSGGGQAERSTDGGGLRKLEDQVMLTPGETSPSFPAETVKSGALNPALSRWLMGFPDAWCDCAVTVTP